VQCSAAQRSAAQRTQWKIVSEWRSLHTDWASRSTASSSWSCDSATIATQILYGVRTHARTHAIHTHERTPTDAHTHAYTRRRRHCAGCMRLRVASRMAAAQQRTNAAQHGSAAPPHGSNHSARIACVALHRAMLHVASRPLHVASRPLHVASRPLHVGCFWRTHWKFSHAWLSTVYTSTAACACSHSIAYPHRTAPHRIRHSVSPPA
jgi:hypothetical protein